MSRIDIDDAELGRIFRECLEKLADEERDYLQKNPRTAKDVRQSASVNLVSIGVALQKAKKLWLSGLEADHLPWPLYVMMMELREVSEGRKSTLLLPDTAEDRPSGQPARNTRMALAKAEAIEVFTRLHAAGWPDEDNASEIAKIFQEHGVTTKGGRGKETISADTIKEWARQARKKNTKNTGLLLNALDVVHRAANDLYSNGDLFSRGAYRLLMLNHLRRYVAGTVYDT